jgi:hypothetical protein
VVLYGCETWSLTFKEEYRLRVFENRVLRRIFGPKRDEVTGGWRKLHNVDVRNYNKILINKFEGRSRDSAVGIAGRPRGRTSSPGRNKNFLISTPFRLVLKPTQPLIQWVLGTLSPEVKRQGVNLTTHLHLVFRSRKRESLQPLPPHALMV